jgi:hypothetical protein
MRILVRPVLVTLVVVLTGCGAEVHVSTKPKKLDGDTLASRANTQLEKQNPKLAHGELTCADANYEVGATSRCMRTVVADDGRLVRIGATVTIDEVKGGGHFKIEVDDEAKEFGVTGKAVFENLSKQYAAKYKTSAPTGSCPVYLAGEVGAKMRCSLVTTDGKLGVEVEVVRVDPKTFQTYYTAKGVN